MTVREVTLPSGRKVEVKSMGIAEIYRIQGHLPNLATKGADDLSADETMRAGIKMVIECCVKPKFFFDLRSEEEIAKSPIDAPRGTTPLDLDVADFWALVGTLSEEMTKIKETVSPLSPTATP